MFKYEEQIIVNTAPKKVYEVVANVEDYPAFIPWCKKATKIKVDEEGNHYFKLEVAFAMFSNYFITKDKFTPYEKIEIDLVEGPFKHLSSIWEFEEVAQNKTLIDFYIAFDFKSKLLSGVVGKFFLDANKKIISSFLERLTDLNK